ncbi:MAG: PEFG-CTERM sorting domain-containing protein, partial [Nitrosopumilus sp.]
GGEFTKFTFAEDQTGPTTIKFENIRNTGQDTEFGIMVAPEFGTIALLVLIVSIASVIFVTRKNSFRLQQV